MSFLFGGGGAKAKPQYSGIQLQTSSQTAALVIAWGGNRFAPNIIWYDDFAAHKQKAQGGKGLGGGSGTTYTYSASCVFALCEGGPTGITGIGQVWKDQDTTATLSSLGMTLFAGTTPQAPWGYLTSKHPDQALSYAGIAYLAVANYDLGTGASIPNHSFEVRSQRVGTGWTGTDDADCAYIIQDFLVNKSYGVLMPESTIDSGQLLSTDNATTVGDASYQTYCRAMGFGLSPILSDQKEAGSSLDQWTKITNTAIVWTGYCLRFVPYCYEPITANGVTFVPATAPVYDLSDDDFIGKSNPIVITRKDPADCYNQQTVTYSNRAHSFNKSPEQWKDQGLQEQYGLRSASDFAAPEITVQVMAIKTATLMGKRSAYIRNTYEFTLSTAYILLEPMDVVVINDPVIGRILVQITKIDEAEKGTLGITAEEISSSVSTSTGYTPQPSNGGGNNTGTPPGPVNTPIIFEPPADMSGGRAQVWAAVSGGDGTTVNKYWGGCYVYVSGDGGASYQNVGKVVSPARQGKLTTALPAYTGANPDTVDSPDVTLAMSAGELLSVSESEAAKGTTLCYIGGEFVTFRDATLVGNSIYQLASLYRGLHGSAASAHAIGSPFARLDDNIFELDLPKQFIGVPLKFKFTSFNIWGNSTQDLSECVEYSYSPIGTGYAIAPPASVNLTFDRHTQADGTSIITGTVAVGASAGPYLDHYDVQTAIDPYTEWTSLAPIGASGTQTQFQPALAATNYKARARAVSSAADGIPSDWVTTVAVGSGGLVSSVPNAPTALAASGGTLSNQLVWTAPAAGPAPMGYRIFAVHAATGLFADAVQIGTSPDTFFTHSGLTPNDTWRYWVVAYNSAGNSAPNGPENATTSASGGGGGSIEVDKSGLSVVASATKLNFAGSGVTVTDQGGGEAKIVITGGGNLVKLAQVVVTATQAHIVFDNISQDYDDLVIVGSIVTQTGAGADSVECQLNNNASNVYSTQTWNHYGIGGASATSSLRLADAGPYIAAGTPQASFEGSIPNYRNTYGSHRYNATNVYSSSSDMFTINYAGQQFTGAAPVQKLDMFFRLGSSFDVGTVITLYGRGGALGAGGGGSATWWFQPPKASEFTSRQGNGSTMVLTDDNDAGLRIYMGPAATGDHPVCASKPIANPSGDWTVEMGFIPAIARKGDYAGMGITLNASSGSARTIVFRHEYNAAGSGIQVGNYTTTGGFVSNAGDGSAQYFSAGSTPNFLKVRHDGATSTLHYFTSNDGKTWWEFYSESDTNLLGVKPDLIGPGGFYNRATGDNSMTLVYWKQSW